MPKIAVPDWIYKHSQKCKQAFGLWDWSIGVRMVNRLKHNGEVVAGLHSTQYTTLDSIISLKATLTDNDFGYSTVTHEFLHVALIEPDIAFRQVMDFIPEKHRAHCRNLYDTAKEHTIEKLARSLTPMLRSVQGTDDKEK